MDAVNKNNGILKLIYHFKKKRDIMKLCCACKVKKDESAFYKDKYTPDGLCYQCIECKKEYLKIHKEETRQYGKKHRIEHAFEIKQYKEKHKEEIAKYQKQYYEMHKEAHQQYSKQYNKKHAKERNQHNQAHREHYLLKHYINIDKKKNLICNLTEQWIKDNITSKSCIYCGDIEFLGCDRIDNSKGHTINNCVPCCIFCNHIRSNLLSLEEMKLLGPVIKQIKNMRKK
jgi:hypothetical protein